MFIGPKSELLLLQESCMVNRGGQRFFLRTKPRSLFWTGISSGPKQGLIREERVEVNTVIHFEDV